MNTLLSAADLPELLFNTDRYQKLNAQYQANIADLKAQTQKDLDQAINDRDFVSAQALNERLWHIARRSGISGSNAGVVLDDNPFKTPYELYLEMTGRVEPNKKESPAMEWGHRLESSVAQKFQDMHNVKLSNFDTFKSSAFGFMSASVDRFVIDNNNKATAILELKTCRFNSSNNTEDGEPIWGLGNEYVSTTLDDGSISQVLVNPSAKCPKYYISQVMHYMLATGVYQGYLAVLIGGSDYRDYNIDFDKKAAIDLLKAEDEFFCKHILDDVAPTLSAKDLKSVTPVKKSSIEANQDILNTLAELKSIKEQQKELEAKENALKNKVIEHIGTNEFLTAEGKTLASYSARAGRASCDIKALELEHPELAKKYVSAGKNYRVFSIK